MEQVRCGYNDHALGSAATVFGYLEELCVERRRLGLVFLGRRFIALTGLAAVSVSTGAEVTFEKDVWLSLLDASAPTEGSSRTLRRGDF